MSYERLSKHEALKKSGATGFIALESAVRACWHLTGSVQTNNGADGGLDLRDIAKPLGAAFILGIVMGWVGVGSGHAN